jgi:flavin reductase (DIM6/NTAB) family NADH-FMN oxidoreductase RutF
MKRKRTAADAAAEFKNAMRRLAAGVTIVATGGAKGRDGLTATAVCSLSAEPPQVLVCVNRNSAPNAAIARARRFSVNILATRHKSLALRFAGATGVQGDARFARGDWSTAETGAPVLADALAWFDCTLVDSMQHGTHTVFIGRVRAAHASKKGVPLLYAAGAFHALAKKAARTGKK